MDAERGQSRWTVAVATVVTQVCLGAVYGWSVFVNPIVQHEGWPLSQVSLIFTLALAFLGLGTIVGGLWQDRVGPRPVITAAGLLYGAGYVIAGVATARHSLVGLYVGYYGSQRSGELIHSPKNCLPGSGWTPLNSSVVAIDVGRGLPIEVNRYVVAHGDERSLVLYWYQSRARARYSISMVSTGVSSTIAT